MRIAWSAEPPSPTDIPGASIGAKLALSFRGMDSEGGERMKRFHDFLAEMDRCILTLVKGHEGALWAMSIIDSV